MIKHNEKFTFNKSDKKSVVYSDLTGTFVMVNDSLLDYLKGEFESKPDEHWCDGKGKKTYLKTIEKKLINENNFFDYHRSKVNLKNERYQKFCNLNVEYLVLRNVVSEYPIPLVHPAIWNDLKKQYGIDFGCDPDFDSNIPVLN